MPLDVRRPIGLLFTLLGALLVVYGLASDPAVHRRSLGYNVNLWWGACVLAFGLVCLALARRGRRATRPPDSSRDNRPGPGSPPRGGLGGERRFRRRRKPVE